MFKVTVQEWECMQGPGAQVCSRHRHVILTGCMGCCCAVILQILVHHTRLLCCPTQVLHVRNVQPATSEEELRHLSAPYGRMVHCKVLRAKAQAFLEMEHVAAAQRLLMAAEADPERFKVQIKIVSNRDLKQVQRPSGVLARHHP